MNVISYTSCGERISFAKDGSGQLELRFPKGTEGTVIIGSLVLPLKNGAVRCYAGQLEDGVHTPYLNSNGSTTRLEAIRIFGRGVDVGRTEDYIIRALLERMRSLELDLSRALLKIEDLSVKICGNGLFEQL